MTPASTPPAVATPLPAAIYDLDGLLIDSEPCWRWAEMELVEAYRLHPNAAGVLACCL